MLRRGLILDLDNTLYSWVDAFLPSFRAMTHVLERNLSVSEDKVLDDFRDIYRLHGTVEYPRAVEELALWKDLDVTDAERIRISSLAEKVFSINYKRHLRLFPHVLEVLEWAKEEKIVVIGLSDALERWVLYRLRSLGIARYFHGLYTWHEDPWFVGRPPVKTSIKARVQLSSSELKPNKEVVERAVSDFSLNKHHTFMVGDSLAKDVVAAKSAGVKDVWARYGTRPSEGNVDTLRRITPWTAKERLADRNAEASMSPPTYVIDDFGELIGLIGNQKPRLFD